MKKFDLSAIMRKAWKLYRKGVAAFSECLHRAWNSAKAEPINAQRIEEAQQAAGVAEPEISYYGMIAAFETLGGEWKRSSDGKHWLIWMGVAAIAPQDNEV